MSNNLGSVFLKKETKLKSMLQSIQHLRQFFRLMLKKCLNGKYMDYNYC